MKYPSPRQRDALALVADGRDVCAWRLRLHLPLLRDARNAERRDRAVRAIKAIIETYAKVRSMVRDMKALQTEKAGSPEQANMLTRAGHKLASLIGDNLTTQSRKTTIELNLALLKITHEVKQGKE